MLDAGQALRARFLDAFRLHTEERGPIFLVRYELNGCRRHVLEIVPKVD